MLLIFVIKLQYLFGIDTSNKQNKKKKIIFL